MRIYISADGEGVTGVVHGTEMHPDGREWEFGRRMMTADVNAAVAGAFDGGASEVLVNDAHWSELNILPEKLDPRAQLLRGSGKSLPMMEGVAECDGVFFVGYHARVGDWRGVGSETLLGREIFDVRVNGRSIGELGINAAVAHHFGVPVLLVTGDDALSQEAEDVVPEARKAVVKYAIARFSARCLSPQATAEIIAREARDAVLQLARSAASRVLPQAGRMVCEVEFVSAAQAAAAAIMPGTERTAARTVRYDAADAPTASRAILAVMLLGARATDPWYG